MQPETQIKAEEKIEQSQNTPANTNPVDVSSKSVEASPDIKSEENKANWRTFRENRDAERKAKQESDRIAKEERARADALKAALEAITNKPSNNHQVNESASGYSEESEEDRIQRRIEETVSKRLEQERQRYRQEQQEREVQEAPMRIQQAYPDFNQVVTTENCDYLDYHYPELTTPFKYMPDGVEKWSAMYKAIKKFVPNIDSKKDQARANNNMSKPGSLSAPGTAQGANAMPGARLDEQRKADNWARMQKTLKGLS
jgi:exonuclease VII large subunit